MNKLWLKFGSVIVGVFGIFVLFHFFSAETDFRYKFKNNAVYVYDLSYQSQGDGTVSPPQIASSNQISQPPSQIAQVNIDLSGPIYLEMKHLRNPLKNKNNSENIQVNATWLLKERHYAVNGADVMTRYPTVYFNWTMSLDGVIHEFSVDEQQAQYTADIMRSVLSMSEFRFSPKQRSAWSSIEKQLGLEVSVLNQCKSAWFAEVMNCSKTYKQNSRKLTFDGELQYRFDRRQGNLLSISGKRSERYGDKKTGSTNTTNLNWSFIERSDIEAFWQARNAHELAYGVNDYSKNKVMISDDLSGTERKKFLHRQLLKNALGTTTVEELKQQTPALNTRSMPDMANYGLKMRALLTLQPDTAEEVGYWLDDYSSDDRRRMTLQAALQEAGTPESQFALLDAAARTEDGSREQRSLMVNMAFARNPIPELETYFRDVENSGVSENIRRQASFALGTVANSLKDVDRGRAEDIYSEALGQLDRSDNDSERKRYLKKIGNIGLEQQVEDLESYIESERKSLRVTAVDALRHVKSNEATNVLQREAQSTDPDVRIAALKGMRKRPLEESTLNYLSDRLWLEKNTIALKLILEGIGHQAQEFPSAIEKLDKFIDACGHPDVCGYARSLRLSIDAS